MRWVIKVGSGVLAGDDGALKRDAVRAIAAVVVALKRRGDDVVLVSSGAVASGFRHLGYAQSPRSLPDRQAAAAVGQFFLVGAYEETFVAAGYAPGLVLLTHEDFAQRGRYLNARNTVQTLLDRGAVPIINENDAVAVEEILLGDNDQLAAMVAALVEADLLVLLTNVDGLYDRAPSDPAARLIARVDDLDAAIAAVSDERSHLGSGGMRTKLLAAAKAASFGIRTVIASGRTPERLLDLAAGAAVGTAVPPAATRMSARRFWIRFVTRPRGEVHVDAGAAQALQAQGRSLLPKGIVTVSGDFRPGDAVRVVGPGGATIGRGLCEYGHAELERIRGRRSDEIEGILGYKRTDEVIHRNDLVLEEGAVKPAAARDGPTRLRA